MKRSFAHFFRHCPHGHPRRTLLLAFTLTILGMPFTPAFSPPMVNHLEPEDTSTINIDCTQTSGTLTITNLPRNDSYRAVHYLIDDRHHLEITGNETSSSNYAATFTLKRNTVQFIRLTNTTSIPDEGPPVAPIPFLLRLRILDPFTRMLGILLLMLIFG